MVSIIIVGYNSKSDLCDCLQSIYESTYKKFRVLFVDNSNDGSVEYIKKEFPSVIIVNNQENLGYAGGNNLLIQKAVDLGSDFCLLLNADTILDPLCLSELIRNSSNNAILQPLLLLYKNGQKTGTINTSGNALNFLGYSYCGNLGQEIAMQNDINPSEIPLASGAAMFIPSKIIKKIGLFDETFFVYHEDADYSFRARLAGFDIKLVPTAKLWHKYQFSKHKMKLYYAERNRLIFILKNFSLKYILLVLPMIVINELGIFIYACLTGWGIEKIRGWFSLISLSVTIHKSRKKLMKLRKVSDNQLKQFISPSIDFLVMNSRLLTLYNFFLVFYWSVIKIFI